MLPRAVSMTQVRALRKFLAFLILLAVVGGGVRVDLGGPPARSHRCSFASPISFVGQTSAARA